MNALINQTCRRITLESRTAWLNLAAADGHLTSCQLREEGAPTESECPLLHDAADQIELYLVDPSNSFNVPLAPQGTPFQKHVWDLTRSIPAGEVRTYMWIAKQLGKPGAVRAVGQALGANPLLLFVPCHRVVRTGGALGGFACGLLWKEALLQHEAVTALH